MNSSLRLDWCSHEAAKYAVEHWHYSRTMPAGKLVKVGAWEDDRFIGCVIFGRGANHSLSKPYGLTQFQCAELARVALTAHSSSVTRIVALGLKLLKRQSPDLRLVISFADPEQGHVGGIYQGGNWIYLGMSDPADEYLVQGVRMHGRSLRALRAGRGASKNALEWARRNLDPHALIISGSSKHRYLMPLDPAMAAQIKPLAKPYPKRTCVGSVDGNAPASPAGVGGSTPTPTLQEAAV